MRPSIFRYLLTVLIAASLVMTALLLLADRAVREATGSLEDVVIHHVQPLAAVQRLQSHIATLRGLELELRQFNDFFAVPEHVGGMWEQLHAIDTELTLLQSSLEGADADEMRRLDEHWRIYRHTVLEKIRLARAMDIDGLGRIGTSRSRGAHDVISAILNGLIERTELEAAQAYRRVERDADVRRQQVTLALVAGLLLLFAVLWYFGRSLSRRITALNRAAHAVALGEEAGPIKVFGNDELTDLGHAFNTMRAKVLEREEELRGAHERLQQRALAAEEATLAKSQFLANMSHEIRTPMNGVLGMLEILRETRMSPEQADYVATAHESATALLDLLNDILDLSKIEAGKVRLEKIDFDLEQVVDDAVSLHAERARAKDLRMTTSIHPQLPHRLHGDPNRLRQVLNNLLSNAVKFTGEGQVRVTVAPTASHDGKPLLHIEVSDTGIGIPPSKQERIFDAFTQADGSTTRRFGGTGLGLSISSQLVHAMDGQIGVDSTPGQGSSFWFTLPLEAADGSVHPVAEALGDAYALVVSGDGELRQELVRRLESWGCRALAVADTAQLAYLARGTSAQARIGLVLVAGEARDAQLAATLDQLRSTAPHARSVLLTPPGHPGTMDDLARLGIDLGLAWPLRKTQLKKALLELLVRGESSAPVVSAAGGYRLRVLVAEDNPINQKVATSMLHKIGCDADVAGNGQEALDLLRAQSYDMVLMDCQMPMMDGFEATTAIRSGETGGTRVPIVAMTAHAMPSDRERCLAAGMNDFLTKPISVEQLRAMIARWREHAPVAATRTGMAQR